MDESAHIKATAVPAHPPAAARPPSPPSSVITQTAEPRFSTNTAVDDTTPPFSPSSQTPVLQKEQEDFEGTVDVTNDLPTSDDLDKVGDLLVLDAQGVSRPFKELYNAPHVAPRQLVIFIRHFFCGICQEYLRTLSSSITPEALLALPTPTFITVIGCGEPGLIPMYLDVTKCPFPIYADPTRKIYDILGMTRTYQLGAKPAYTQANLLVTSVQSVFQGIGSGKRALKGGDFKQVGGEFLFEDGECTWVNRMRTTRDHTEVSVLRGLLGLDDTRPPIRKRWSYGIKEGKSESRRSLSWGRLRSKSKSKSLSQNKNKGMVEIKSEKEERRTPERVEEEPVMER